MNEHTHTGLSCLYEGTHTHTQDYHGWMYEHTHTWISWL